jgi:glyoxylase-like metal-dependent hydrolase (beta-lactamase superfamily II)
MVAKEITTGVYEVPLHHVNAWLIDGDGLTLVDTGVPGSADTILASIRELGKQPADVRHILVSHAHPDHIGSLAALKRATGAKVYAHPLDAPIIRNGAGFRPLTPAPGLLVGLLFRLFIPRPFPTVDGTGVDVEIADGDELPIGGGLKVVHIPGHCRGQVAFLRALNGGLLFAADACATIPRLGWSLGHEDFEEGRRSLAKLSALSFDVACFGHGKAIRTGAAARFRQKWGSH